MHDLKNILLAWVSASPVVMTVTGERGFITVMSAIILPILFFTVGKAVDACLQIYFQKRQERRNQNK